MSDTADIPGQLAIDGAPISAPSAEPAPKRVRKPRSKAPTTETTDMQPTTSPGEQPNATPSASPSAATFTDPVARLMNLCATHGADLNITVLTSLGARIAGIDPIPGDSFDPDALDLPPGNYRMRVRGADGSMRGTFSYSVAGDPRAADHPQRAIRRELPAVGAQGSGLDADVRELIHELRASRTHAPAPRLDWLNNLPAIITAASGILTLMRPQDQIKLADLLPLLKPEKAPVTEMIEALGTLDTLRGEPAAPSGGSADGEMVRMLMPLIGAALQQPANPRANDPNYQRAPARDPALPPPPQRVGGAPAMNAGARPQAPAPESPTTQATGAGARRMQPLPDPRADDAIGALALTLAEAARRNQPPRPAAAYALSLFDGGEIMQAMGARGADFPAVESFTDASAAATSIIDALSAAEPELLTPIRPFMLAVRDEVIDLMRDDDETPEAEAKNGAQQA